MLVFGVGDVLVVVARDGRALVVQVHAAGAAAEATRDERAADPRREDGCEVELRWGSAWVTPRG